MDELMDTDCVLLSASRIGARWNGVQVLDGVSVTVKAGQVVCLCGPNGCGKSTLLSVLAGVTVSGLVSSGQVQMMGTDVRALSKKQLACRRAYLLQHEESAWNYTVRDIVLMGRFSRTKLDAVYSEHDFAVTDSVLERVQISELSGRSVRSLSGGELQKVRIARCLAAEPELFLLDEPLSGLDFGYQEELMRLLVQLAHDEGKSVLVTIHDVNLAARFADRLLFLPRLGRCMEGTVREMMEPDALARTYGYRFGVFEHPVYGCRQAYILYP